MTRGFAPVGLACALPPQIVPPEGGFPLPPWALVHFASESSQAMTRGFAPVGCVPGMNTDSEVKVLHQGDHEQGKGSARRRPEEARNEPTG